MTGLSDGSHGRAVATPAAVFRYLYLRLMTADRGWKATIIGLIILILIVIVQS
jgi:hypothetical protein